MKLMTSTFKTAAITAALFCQASVLSAAPLPDGTVLLLEPGANPDATGQCQTGSCFGLEVAPDMNFWIWSNLAPGLDGGIVIGKEQASGGQELATSTSNTTPGEMTDAFYMYGYYATLSSLPGGAGNIFNNASCTGIGCIGKTEIQALYFAWTGHLMVLAGSEFTNWEIALDGNGGGRYTLDHSSVIPEGIFTGLTTRVIVRGDIIFPPGNNAPVAYDVYASGEFGSVIDWLPDYTDPDADNVNTCEIAVNASNGNATVNSDCSTGSYTPGDGFEGLDSFEYTVTDQGGLSATATVSVAVNPVPNSCTDLFRLVRIDAVGGGQGASVNATLTTSFTGNITVTSGLITGGKNAVNICPDTTVTYEAISTVGTAVCSINGAASGSMGRITVGDKLICTNKPDGGDVDRFSIKSGF